MLTEWTLGNFKSIANKVNLQIAPLTILVGENSSGKSSILQSILLLAQTLKATESRQPLILNGEFIRLGYLSDIVHQGQDNFPLNIGFVLQPFLPGEDANNGKSRPLPIQMDLKIQANTHDNQNVHEGVLSNIELRRGENDTISLERTFPKGNTLVDREENADIYMPPDLRTQIDNGFFDYTVQHIRFTKGKWLNQIDPYVLHARLYHFLPNKILETYNVFKYSVIVTLKLAASYLRLKETRPQIIDELKSVPPLDLVPFKETLGAKLRDEIQSALFFNIPTKKSSESSHLSGSIVTYLREAQDYLEKSPSLIDWLIQVKKNIPGQHTRTIAEKLLYKAELIEAKKETDGSFFWRPGARATELPESIAEIQSQIIQYFSQRIYYLGPLRMDPQFIYSLPPYPELTHVGLKGEFTASVLERFKNTIIDYPLPPTLEGKLLPIEKGSLDHALDVWVDYMKLLRGAHTIDRGKMGTEMAVKLDGVEKELDLTSIGVGVSQVLPTLVMGLIAPPGTTFLLEQPELHLHPKVQSALADFFLGLTRVGKQFIVETHSEYLVNRVRRRVAEDEDQGLDKKTKIYFVERNNGKSSFRALDMNQYGALLDWPEGFFDEGPNESELIMRAALKKRQQMQEAENKK